MANNAYLLGIEGVISELSILLTSLIDFDIMFFLIIKYVLHFHVKSRAIRVY